MLKSFGLLVASALCAQSLAASDCANPKQRVVAVFPEWTQSFADLVGVNAMHPVKGGGKFDKLYAAHDVSIGYYANGVTPRYMRGPLLDARESCLLLDLDTKQDGKAEKLVEQLGASSTPYRPWWKEVTKTVADYNAEETPLTYAAWRAAGANTRRSGNMRRFVVAAVSRTPIWASDDGVTVDTASGCNIKQYPGRKAFDDHLKAKSARVIWIRMNDKVELPGNLDTNLHAIVDFDGSADFTKRFGPVREAIQKFLGVRNAMIDVQMLIEGNTDKAVLDSLFESTWASESSEFVPGQSWYLSYTRSWDEAGDGSAVCYQPVGIVGSSTILGTQELLSSHPGLTSSIDHAVYPALAQIAAARERRENQPFVMFIITDWTIGSATGTKFQEEINCAFSRWIKIDLVRDMFAKMNIIPVVLGQKSSGHWAKELKTEIAEKRAAYLWTSEYNTIMNKVYELIGKDTKFSSAFLVGPNSSRVGFLDSYWARKPENEVSSFVMHGLGIDRSLRVKYNGSQYPGVQDLDAYGVCYVQATYRHGMPLYGVSDLEGAIKAPVSLDAADNPITYSIIRAVASDQLDGKRMMIVHTNRKPAFDEDKSGDVDWASVLCQEKVLPSKEQFEEALRKYSATVLIQTDDKDVKDAWAKLKINRVVTGSLIPDVQTTRTYVLVDTGDVKKLNDAMRTPVSLSTHHKVIPAGNWEFNGEPACLLTSDTFSTGFKTLDFELDKIQADKSIGRAVEISETDFMGGSRGAEYGLYRALVDAKPKDDLLGGILYFFVRKDPAFTSECQDLSKSTCLNVKSVCLKDVVEALNSSPYGRVVFVGTRQIAEAWTKLFEGGVASNVSVSALHAGENDFDNHLYKDVCASETTPRPPTTEAPTTEAPTTESTPSSSDESSGSTDCSKDKFLVIQIHA